MAITYDAPTNTITVTGYTEGTPCTFLDIFNADVGGGWGVVTMQGTTQFQFDCKLKIGDGVTETWFSDINKQITLSNGIVANNNEWLIRAKANATLIFGEVIAENWRLTTNGVSLMSLEDTYTGTNLIDNNDGTIYLYSSYFNVPSYGGRAGLFGINRIWNSLLVNNVAIENTPPSADIYNVIITGSWQGVSNPQGRYEKIGLIGIVNRPMNFGMAISSTILNPVIVNLNAFKYTFTTWALTADVYIIDMENNYPVKMDWGSTNTGKIYLQYTTNLMVTEEDGTAIETATVKLLNEAGGTVFSVQTDAQGEVAEQTVSRGYYDQANGDVLQDYGPFDLHIYKEGYRIYKRENIVLDEPIDWRIRLFKRSY